MNINKITRKEFLKGLFASFEKIEQEKGSMANQEKNLKHNYFNSRLGTIVKCDINNITFYYCVGMPEHGAYKNITSLKREITKIGGL